MDALTSLALDAQRGDRAALEHFVRRSQVDIWRFCAHLSGAADADDLTQEVFLRALGALASFRAESSARTWLLGIARRVCADHVRRSMRRRRLHERVQQEPRSPATPSGTGWHELVELLVDLPEDQRSAFTLTQVLGLSYLEAAEICECPVGTIRSRVARAREALLAAVTDARDAGRSLGES